MSYICKILMLIGWLNISIVCAVAQPVHKEKECVLIISSYSSDSKRVTDFLNDFRDNVIEESYPYTFTMVYMGYRGFNGSNEWREMMKEVIEKYKDQKLAGVVLLGQEAWSSYLDQDIILDAPFYGCYISENGIIIPDGLSDYVNWKPQNIDTRELAQSRGHSGGVMNFYDVSANVRLIKHLYPSVNNIAFISDNTYGGVAMQALVREVMARNFPDLQLTLLDGRKLDVSQLQSRIAKLPYNTAVLIGTWRVDKLGSYFLQGSINDLFPKNFKLPVFTISGIGLGTVAIGGCIPSYQIRFSHIVEDIFQHTQGKDIDEHFIRTENQYTFDREKMAEYGVQEYQLPKNSKIVSRSDLELKKYRVYIVRVALLLVGFMSLCVFILLLYLRNRKFSKELKESNVKANLAIEASEILLWEYNVKKRVFSSYASDGLTKEKAYNLEDYRNVTHIEDMEEAQSIWNIMEEGLNESFKIEIRYKVKEHPEFGWLRGTVQGVPFGFDKSGKVTKYSGFSRNDTKWHVLNEELKKSNVLLSEAKEQAEQSNKLKSAFLANMSHEIRTPLNAIIGFSDLLKDAETEEEKHEYWNIISTNNDLLLRLIGDILDLSKIESGMIELKPETFDMVLLFGEIDAIMEQRINNPEVKLIQEQPYASCLVTLDRNRVSQVITNFITNAIKFTKQGYIKMGYVCENEGVKIFVEDTGIGIEPQKIDKVFERFYKLNDFAQGTGLGMSICKAIMDAQDGTIGVESKYGEGTRFWAWFPCKGIVTVEDGKQ